MKTPLVLLNLLHQPRRTSVAVLGVAFAILLVFMQLSFYGTVQLSASRLYDALDFDLLVHSRNYLCLTSAQTFARYRLQQTEGHAEVARAVPLYLHWQLWRNSQGIKYYEDSKKRHYRRVILALAFNPADGPIFRRHLPYGAPPTSEMEHELDAPNTILVDTYTRSYFGKHGKGDHTELNGVDVTVADMFTIGPGLGADGLVVMSDRTYALLAGFDALERPSLGLIKLKKGARSPAAVKDELKNLLAAGGADVEVLTRAEVEKKEREYWKRIPVAVIFTLGVLVACLVGAIFTYQVIATDIADHSGEYATLRAMGYSSRYLSGVVLRQAAALAVLGYVPGLLLAWALCSLGRWYEKILLFLPWERAAGVLLLSLTMCSLSGLLAIQLKVKTVDPADLF